MSKSALVLKTNYQSSVGQDFIDFFFIIFCNYQLLDKGLQCITRNIRIKSHWVNYRLISTMIYAWSNQAKITKKISGIMKLNKPGKPIYLDRSQLFLFQRHTQPG